MVLSDEIKPLSSEALRRGVKLEFVRLTDKLFRLVVVGFCPFYSIVDRRCTIHETKPLSCSMFPLLINVETKDIHISAACDWALQHINILLDGNIDIEEVFKDEVYALKKLYKSLFTQR